MTSYITLLSKIEAFCNAHLQIKKYKGEFREQMPNFSTEDEKYPVVFVSPTSDVEDMNTNQFTVDIYCVDIIQKDRANLNTALSDCHLILKDLYTYYKDDGDSVVDVVGTASMNPLNNFDLDYVVGWVMSITFEVGGYGKCAIPMNPIPPFEPSCEDATYEITDSDLNILYSGSIVSGGNLDQVISDSTVVNSDATYSVSVLAEGSLVLPDITVTDSDGSSSSFPSAKNVTCTPSPDTDLEVNGVLEGSVTAGSTVDIQLSDSNGVVVPDSVTQVGNDLQIVLPSAPTPTYLVDDFSPLVAFSIRKISSTATNCIRVRRSNDNAEQDIGFVGDDLDILSLNLFVGGNSGFIVKIYNQGTGGGAQDATTASASVQPRIINSGTIDSVNGRPAIFFDGTNDYLITNTSLGLTAVNYDTYFVHKKPSTSSIIFDIGGAFTLCGVNGDGSASSNLGANAPDFYYKNGASVVATTRDNVFDNVFNNNQNLIVQMGLNSSSGGNYGGYGGFQVDGYLQELVYFRNTDTTVNRTNIELNINGYYGIY
jgi:hypothetical protein